ncbi:MAG: hypothetical protein B6D79_06730 [gamma proteobacterium symbiont of Ctena orbiculata]|nr:MAG: hypothetical protein B6D79_06730 [gamma proteobacterium symbiont of Ctena orbiculata]
MVPVIRTSCGCCLRLEGVLDIIFALLIFTLATHLSCAWMSFSVGHAPKLRYMPFLCTALKHSEKVKIIVKKISIVRFDKKNSAVQKNQLNLSK